MSDPAKSSEEIEDVLASIRRLVSDHGVAPARPRAVAQHGVSVAPAPASAPAPAAVVEEERLVLTPSFRISEPEAPMATAPLAEADDALADSAPAETAQAEATDALIAELMTADALAAAEQAEQAELPKAARTNWHHDDRMAEFDTVGHAEADAAGLDTDDDSDGAEVVAGTDDAVDADESLAELAAIVASPEDLDDLARLDGVAAEPADFESETGDENWPGDNAEAALLTLVKRRDLGADAEVADLADDPAEAEADAATPVAADPAVPGEADEDVAERSEDPSIEAGTSENILAEDAAEAAEEIAAIARDESEVEDTFVLTGVPDAEDADESDAAPQTTAPLFSRRAAKAAQSPEAHEEADEEALGAEADFADLGADPDAFDFPDDEDKVLDEDTLREIIIDVVREELQGVLGQRITRNVRKLVRREVRLALAAEDLE